ncbi:MAG: class I adenylate-forming enzyme family protein, partial [Opitutaceae bacterium]
MKGSQDPPLLAAWKRTVRRSPESLAVREIEGGLRRSRRQLDRDAARWAECEDPHGPGWRGRVRFFSLPNCAAWFATFLWILKRGGIPAPLDPGEPPEVRERIARGAPLAAAFDDPRCSLLKLTSGSTGSPRALPFTGRQMLADGAHICATMGIRPDDVNLAVVPFGHSYGLGNLVIPLLAQGTAVACAVAALPHPIAKAAAAARATVFPAVPRLLEALADSELPAGAFPVLRLVISAGAPLEPALARRFRERFGIAIHNFYGSSETGGIAYDRTGDAGLTGRAAGTPLRGVRVSFGPARRFLVRSAAVHTLGNRRVRTSAALGEHAPADRGRKNADGELVLLGRVGRLLKIAGRRLDPAEVERALRAAGGVRDCFVGVHPE